ncbi:MAG TPA: hypothetical protein VHC43_05770 [Mycobacteriales bacterium]|nr:hypothetical protein [Mycobacteriales bacterium]
MGKKQRAPELVDLADKDPVDVLRRMLAISPEDPEKARAGAAEAAKSSNDSK